MIDQLIIGDKASFDDFAASVAERKIKMPKKKSIKETVPFSNVTYDFSAIDGETYWEERVLEYVFEITADTPEEMEELKSRFASWVMNVQEAELRDPYIPGYHFKATYDDMDANDDEGLEKTTLTVTFTAYPYMIADDAKVYEVTLAKSGQTTLQVLNESTHPVIPTLYCSNVAELQVGGNSYAMSLGTTTDASFKIPAGMTDIKVKNGSSTAVTTVKISFNEEVF